MAVTSVLESASSDLSPRLTFRVNQTTETAMAATGAALWKTLFTPLDVYKHSLQVDGASATNLLRQKLTEHGLRTFYHGATATFMSNAVAYLSLIYTHRTLDRSLPSADSPYQQIARNGTISFVSAAAGAIVANPFRMLTVYKQTKTGYTSYFHAAKQVLSHSSGNSLMALVTRGLGGRIALHGVQMALFTVGYQACRHEYYTR